MRVRRRRPTKQVKCRLGRAQTVRIGRKTTTTGTLLYFVDLKESADLVLLSVKMRPSLFFQLLLSPSCSSDASDELKGCACNQRRGEN